MDKSALHSFIKELSENCKTIDELIQQECTDVSLIDVVFANRPEVLSKWLSISSNDNPKKFKEVVSSRINEIKLNNQNTEVQNYARQWTEDAEWVLSSILESSTSLSVQVQDKLRDIPFIDFFATLITKTKSDLLEKMFPESRILFAVDGIDSLVGLLARDLAELYSPLVYKDFEKYRKTATSRDGIYKSYINLCKNGRFLELIRKYPILLRLLVLVVQQWIGTQSEFINRLTKDYALISRELVEINSCNPIVEITGGVSDKHNYGRSVLIIRLKNNQSFLYKPKIQKAEKEFFELINDLNLKNPPFLLKAPKTLDMETYGWVQYIGNSACGIKDDFELFFGRAGGLLSLMHILQVKDLHDENIIASGSFPIPIDLEVLFQSPTTHGSRFENAAFAAWRVARQKIDESVLSVGLLPNIGQDKRGKVYDLGGFRSGNQVTSILIWRKANTDQMHPQVTAIVEENKKNIPRTADDVYGLLCENIDHFVSGFCKYGLFLKTNGEQTMSKFLNQRFKNCQTRELKKPTAFYHLLIKRLMNHSNFADGLNWSLQAEFLYRYVDPHSENGMTELADLSIERNQLLGLSIPTFFRNCDDVSQGQIGAESELVSPRERSLQRYQELNESILNEQASLIRWSLGSLISSGTLNRRHDPNIFKETQEVNADLLLYEKVDDRLHNIARVIQTNAIRQEQSAIWIGLDWFEGSEVHRINTLNSGLYSGNLGIAIFTAAYYRYTKDIDFLKLCKQSLSILILQIKNRGGVNGASLKGFGVGHGAGSAIYGLSTLYEILGDDAYLHLCFEYVASLKLKDIKSEEYVDVISGLSGFLLAILKLLKFESNRDILNVAIEAGKTIRDRIVYSTNTGAKFDTGFSHGLSGIAYALIKLGVVSKEGEFVSLGMRLIGDENLTFSKEYGNWPDRRVDPFDYTESKWCHGACGIGLSRLGVVELIGEDNEGADLTGDISNSVVAAKRLLPADNITACCGAIGNFELLKGALRRGISTVSAKDVDICLRHILSQYSEISEKTWGPEGEKLNLSFFQGISGVGYALLRNGDPSLPNVLLFE